MGAYEDEQPDHADEQYAVDERENAAMGIGGVSSDGLECLFARFALFHVLQYFAFLLRWASMNHGLKMNWSGRLIRTSDLCVPNAALPG